MAGNATATHPRAAPLTIARSVPAWVWLAGLVGVSIGIRLVFARRMAAPWIMVDELIYSELAKSFAATGHFLWRGQPIHGYSVVYPVLLSPAWRVFSSIPRAYAAAKGINAVVISLAAVPAYLLARRVLSQPLALLAAALTLAVPSMLYAGTLMTENAFYPAFLLAALALVACLERPTWLNQVLLLASLLLAYEVRAQALALVPAVVTAPLLLAWIGRRGLRSLAAYRVLWGVLGGGTVLYVLLDLVRGRSLRSILGAYETAGHQHYAVGAVAKWFVYHVAELDLYVGVAPFAALLVLVVLARRQPRPVQVFLAAAVSLTFWLLLLVAAFASLPTVERVEERNMFYAAPLLFVALLAWIERGAPRPARVAVPAAVLAAALPPLLPYSRLIGVPAQSDTLMLLPWWWLQDHVLSLSDVWIEVLAAAAGVAALFVALPRRLVLVLPAVVLVYFAVTLGPIENGRHGIRMASLGALFQGITNHRVDWIDRAVGHDARVAVLWSGHSDAFTLWENEFFNRSVGPVYELADPLGGGLPATRVHADSSGFLRDPSGRPVRVAYALADGTTPLLGRTVASDRPKGIELVRLAGPLRIASVVRGIYAGDTWSGPRVTYMRRECAGGRLSLQLLGDAHLFAAAQSLSVAPLGLRLRIPAGTPRTVVLPLRRGPDGRCRLTLTISPTAVPAQQVPGSRDRRRLGLHFLSFEYLPPRSRVE